MAVKILGHLSICSPLIKSKWKLTLMVPKKSKQESMAKIHIKRGIQSEYYGAKVPTAYDTVIMNEKVTIHVSMGGNDLVSQACTAYGVTTMDQKVKLHFR